MPSTSLIMGKLSGRNAFRDKLESLGYHLEPAALNDAFKRFKDLADSKKEIYDEDVIALVDEEAARHLRKGERISFVSLQVEAGSKSPQVAELELTVDGELKTATARGNGPVDAIFSAIRAIFPHPEVDLQLFQVHAVTGGTDAQARVTVKLEEAGVVTYGQSADADTMVASCCAYLHALNKMILKQGHAERHEVGP